VLLDSFGPSLFFADCCGEEAELTATAPGMVALAEARPCLFAAISAFDFFMAVVSSGSCA